VVGRVTTVEIPFYSSGGCESECPRRVTGGGDVDLILLFRLEGGGDEMKYYQKMKWRQRAPLGSMGRKRGDIGWRRCGTGR
jgi:hypothetical protein